MFTLNCHGLQLARTSPRSSGDVRSKMKQGWLLLVTLCTEIGLMAIGCSGPEANLVITAPATVVAGSPLTVTVSAKVNGRPDTIFNSVIHFSSSDPTAVLPPDYVYTEADAGSHAFTNGVMLMTIGSQSVTATDTATSFLTATANVTVSSESSTGQ